MIRGESMADFSVFPPGAPRPGPVRNVSFPNISVRELANGLRLLSVKDNSLPRLTLRLAFSMGRSDFPAGNLALPEMALHLLREGTLESDSRQIAERIDRLAIDLECEAEMEFSTVSMTFLSNCVDEALQLLSELIQSPAFPDDEVERLRTRWRNQLIAQRSQPEFLSLERTHLTLFPGHPYSRVSIPIPDLDSADPSSIRNFYQAHFGPLIAWVLMAGPLGADAAQEKLERYFASWDGGPKPTDRVPEPDLVESRQVCIVHRSGSVQSRIVACSQALPLAHPEETGLQVANQIFGGGGSARLFLNLREDKGLTYGAFSRIRSFRSGGLLAAGASVRADATVEAVREMLGEAAQMGGSPPSPHELARAKAELVGAFIRRLETPAARGTLDLIRRLHALPDNYWSEYIPRIQSMTSQGVQEISSRIMDPGRFSIVIVGDRQMLGEGLSEFGPVTVYDTQGRLL